MLVLFLLTPLLFAALTALVPDGMGGRVMALAGSVLTLGVGVVLALWYDWAKAGVQFGYSGMELSGVGFGFRVGLDTIGLWLSLLTCVLGVVSVLANWRGIEVQSQQHHAWTCVMIFALLGVWMSRDLLLFYFFYELTLLPLFFLVGIWGGDERRAAAAKLFLYAFFGSVFTLAALVYLGLSAGTFDMGQAIRHAQMGMTQDQRWWVLLGLLAGFLIKTPLFPLHTWLPQTHEQSSAPGGTDVIGMQLKIGAFGLLTIALPVGLIDAGGNIAFPTLTTVLGVLAVSAIIYAGLIAWVQKDAKKVIAYSSVSHLGFVVLGILAASELGLQSAVLYMINTALATGALFLIVGMIQLRLGSRNMENMSGLARLMPGLAFFGVFFTMAAVGLPGIGPFVAEFLAMLSVFRAPHLGVWMGVLAALGILISAVYMLTMLARVLFGPVKLPAGVNKSAAKDLDFREVLMLTSLAVPLLLLGVLPSGVLKSLLPDVAKLLQPQGSRVAWVSEAAAVEESVVAGSKTGAQRP